MKLEGTTGEDLELTLRYFDTPTPDVDYNLIAHGTNADLLDPIKVEGIKPRGRSKGNWQHTVTSNSQTVYLSNAYAMHFAHTTQGEKHDLALIEVDIKRIDPFRLQADEDVVEQAYRDRDDLPKEWTLKQRTLYYRNRAHRYSAEASLKAMGTCGHRGVITPKAMKRVCIIEREKAIELIAQAFDPIICLMNYKIMGKRYRAFQAWLFGDVPEWFGLTRDGITVKESNE